MKISLCYKINKTICEKFVKYKQEKKKRLNLKKKSKRLKEKNYHFLKKPSFSHEIRRLGMKAPDCDTWEIFHV